jgi:hypothetical protein
MTLECDRIRNPQAWERPNFYTKWHQFSNTINNLHGCITDACEQ